jgi:hypothetical protein
LLSRIERCLRRTGLSPTRFGRLAVNDGRLIHDLRRGRELRSGTRERILRSIEEIEQERAR